MNVPAELRYTRDHEWIRVEGREAVVGITDFAQESLGGVVFVELPAAGTQLAQGATFGAVESNKAVSDLYAPVSGDVLAVNDALAERPELVNDEPYGAGWMLRITIADPEQLEALLDADAYAAHVASEQAT
jgi:glycine cleavage system H protein